MDQTPNATEEEKAAAKSKVDEVANNAKASIGQATKIKSNQRLLRKTKQKQRLIMQRKLRKLKSIEHQMRQKKNKQQIMPA
ncbi:DUF1542 domain-containing protein [Staphylococcus haemolyticus]|uniref:DUF1542 domain-containing protein n=1 Tax=Staphylococcus haemolyticus TaxID=1283 RepID=UPI003C6F7D09